VWPPSGAGWPPAPPPRRRFPIWVVGVSVLTLVFIMAATLVQFAVRPGATDHEDEFRFLARRLTGEPVRWNPCETIHYVVNLDEAPPDSLGDVQEAIRRVSVATGITFEFDGPTSEQPIQRRPSYQPERYGDRWAPVLIAWVDPDESSIAFAHSGHLAAGVAAPQIPTDGEQILVSGWVAINADDPNPPGFDLIGAQGPVVLHELGHVMGLDHVQSYGELMEGSGGGVTDFGPGDLEGLHELGRSAGCLTTPDPP
jgi:hypothetical protein